jgi:hypothetical protein
MGSEVLATELYEYETWPLALKASNDDENQGWPTSIS